MPVTEIKYGENKSLPIWRVDGAFYPVLKRPMPDDYDAYIRGIRSLGVRSDDIYVFSYPKTGAHWLHDIIEMLLTGNQEPSTNPVLPILEFYDMAKLEAMSSPRVLHCHSLPDVAPNGVVENGLRTILLRRNPKDIIVSFWEFCTAPNVLKTPFEDTLECFTNLTLDGNMTFGSPIDHGVAWELYRMSHPAHPIHIVHYEDLHSNTKQEIERLAQFLHVDLTQSCLENIKQKCSFSYIKHKKSLNPGTEVYTQSLYRKGVVGDSENHYSVALSEQIDRMCASKAEASGVDVVYKYQ